MHWTKQHPPSPEAAISCARHVDAERYAQTRNHLKGAVSGLSPYITHGLLELPQALMEVPGGPNLPIGHKWVAELGWRAFFRHVWDYAGDAILQSMRPGVLPDSAYANTLPIDVIEGRTGIPAIDQAVRGLYQQGMLHNHARMWLASYVVHVRRVHWRVGADWMVAHLIDGDLASNHLSWQWVAGTFSNKPYLFNAENVARWAPRTWDSKGSEIDQDYDTLNRWAIDPAHTRESGQWPSTETGVEPPQLCNHPPPGLEVIEPQEVDFNGLTGQEVTLIHPWNLSTTQLKKPGLKLGVYLKEHHTAWPWTEMRWRWVQQAMASATKQIWWVDAQTLSRALRQAVRSHGVYDPHICQYGLPVTWTPKAALFPPVDRACGSFSVWWKHATRGKKVAHELFRTGTENPSNEIGV